MYDAHIICRFSSQDKEDASIERQKEQCLIMAQKLGCDSERVKIIANDNLSGALSWDRRIDLLELESDIIQKRCRRLIVYRFDRLARDFEVSGRLLNLLREYNIQMYDESGELNYLTAAGEAFFGMKSVFASFERRMIRDRMYAGKLYHFKQGTSWGGPLPLGLKRDGKKIVEDIEGMKIVNIMFNYISQGWSIKQIETWTMINGINLKKPCRGGGICDWSIKAILTNKFYTTGEYVIRTQSEGELKQMIHLTYPVSLELFDTVKGILKSRTPGRPPKGTYLLTGLVYPVLPLSEDIDNYGVDFNIKFRAMKKNGISCYYCREWGKVRREGDWYIRAQSQRHRKQFSFIQKEKLENIVWDALEKITEDPKKLLESVNAKATVLEADKEILTGLIRNKEQEVRKLEFSLDRFYDLYGQTGDPDDLKKIQTTKQQLNQARKELKEIQNKHETVNLTLDDAVKILETNTFRIIHDLRLNGSIEAKLAFIQKYVNRIEIDPLGNVEIVGYFNVPTGTNGSFGKWLYGHGKKGAIMIDNLTSYNYRDVESSQVVP